MPPLVAWAATTGRLSMTAMFLFALIFMWTPPHFWALSLLMRDDYARAGVPMLPVVRGEDETRWQVQLYAVMLAGLSLLPALDWRLPFDGIYLACAAVLGTAFVALAARLRRRADRQSALRLYLFSLAYLALLFAAMVADVRL
jgi:protoheme IX farnesyltransferase